MILLQEFRDDTENYPKMYRTMTKYADEDAFMCNSHFLRREQIALLETLDTNEFVKSVPTVYDMRLVYADLTDV